MSETEKFGEKKRVERGSMRQNKRVIQQIPQEERMEAPVRGE